MPCQPAECLLKLKIRNCQRLCVSWNMFCSHCILTKTEPCNATHCICAAPRIAPQNSRTVDGLERSQPMFCVMAALTMSKARVHVFCLQRLSSPYSFELLRCNHNVKPQCSCGSLRTGRRHHWEAQLEGCLKIFELVPATELSITPIK